MLISLEEVSMGKDFCLRTFSSLLRRNVNLNQILLILICGFRGKVEEPSNVLECENEEFDIMAFEVLDEIVKRGDDAFRVDEFKLSEFT